MTETSKINEAQIELILQNHNDAIKEINAIIETYQEKLDGFSSTMQNSVLGLGSITISIGGLNKHFKDYTEYHEHIIKEMKDITPKLQEIDKTAKGMIELKNILVKFQELYNGINGLTKHIDGTYKSFEVKIKEYEAMEKALKWTKLTQYLVSTASVITIISFVVIFTGYILHK